MLTWLLASSSVGPWAPPELGGLIFPAKEEALESGVEGDWRLRGVLSLWAVVGEGLSRLMSL